MATAITAAIVLPKSRVKLAFQVSGGDRGIMQRWLSVLLAVGIFAGAALAQQAALPAPSPADDARLKALGQHLARECTTCHRLDGVDNGIPGIIGLPVADFIETMGFYKGGQRTNQAMMSVAQSLDDEQTRALALWFNTQPAAAKKPQPAPKKK